MLFRGIAEALAATSAGGLAFVLRFLADPDDPRSVEELLLPYVSKAAPAPWKAAPKGNLTTPKVKTAIVKSAALQKKVGPLFAAFLAELKKYETKETRKLAAALIVAPVTFIVQAAGRDILAAAGSVQAGGYGSKATAALLAATVSSPPRPPPARAARAPD